MNNYLWSIAVNCLAAGLSFADTKVFILSQVAGDADAKTEASTQMDDSETLLEDQADLDPDDRASWYIQNLPGLPAPVVLGNAEGDTLSLATSVTGVLDGTGLGSGGAVKLKSPDGTEYLLSIANGGTTHVVAA